MGTFYQIEDCEFLVPSPQSDEISPTGIVQFPIENHNLNW